MQPLSIDHAPVVLPYLKAQGSFLSELTLSNLLFWRHKYHFHYTTIGSFLLLQRKKEGGICSYSQPLGPSDRNNEILKIVKSLKEENSPLVFRKTDATFAQLITQCFPNAQVEADRDAFDYLYSFASLRDLPGNDYHKKRNHINRFLSLGLPFRYEVLEKRHLPLVADFADRWLNDHPHGDDAGLQDENRAIHEALSLFDQLPTSGGVLIVEDQIKAFTLSEPLSEDTLVIHFEKAHTDLPGLYPLIMKTHLEHQDETYLTVNREQDLGIPGLRKAKLSLHPERLLQKYTITLP